MQLGIHIGLLAAAIAATIACVVGSRGRVTRSLGAVLVATTPFLLLALLSVLLLSAKGAPLVEWVLPMIAVLVVGLACGSDRVFDVFRWSMTVVSVVLFANFMSLIQGDYTSTTFLFNAVNQSTAANAKRGAASDLQEHFGSEQVVPEGPVSAILDDPRYDRLEILVAERQWYTPILRLSRVRREGRFVWCPGGEVATASKRLEVREAARVRDAAAHRG